MGHVVFPTKKDLSHGVDILFLLNSLNIPVIILFGVTSVTEQ